MSNYIISRAAKLLLAFAFLVSASLFLFANEAGAQGCASPDPTTGQCGAQEASLSGAAGCSGDLLGLIPPWHKNICKGGEIEVSELNELLVIGFNIVDMLLAIMVIVAILFFIVGSIRLIASSGKPEGVAAASKTMANSVIGLAIGLSAGTIAAFLSETFSGVASGDNGAARPVLEIAIEIGAAVAIIMIVKAAIQYITSAGEAQKVAGAKKTILFTIIGLILMISAYALISVVVGSL